MMESYLFNKFSQNELKQAQGNEEESAIVDEQNNTDEQEDENSSYILGYN